MTATATEENTRASHSRISLGIPHKERENKRISKSESFIKPTMMNPFSYLKTFLKKPRNYQQQSGSSLVESVNFLTIETDTWLQGQQCLREEKTTVTQDSHKPGDKTLLSNTRTILGVLQQNKSKAPCRKHPNKSENKSKKEGGSIPKEEWKTLTRPAAKVVLDPNTANPSLKLSSDGRSVRTVTHSEFHSNQRHYEYQRKYKHQYNGWTCVQAEEGYDKGRHYWEVDVKGKCEWRIGVVKESAPRNGFCNLNTDTGYWTLRLQLGCVMALTYPVTKLNQAPLSTIGVLLDYEECRVSFYDAVNRKHIYTFQEEFGETVYPVFGTVETDIPLRIIQISL